MRVLEIDIGNTFIKWRFIVSGVVNSRGCAEVQNVDSLGRLSIDVSAVDRIQVSSVASEGFNSLVSGKLVAMFGKDPWFALSSDELVGVTNGYANSSELGVDRWLAIVAAWVEFKRDVVVIDCGTALTIDIVDQWGCHLGGYIVPGQVLMKRALLSDTANVECNDLAGDQEIRPGENTRQAVKNGIALAQIGAVYTVLAKLRKDSLVERAPAVVFCGGAGELLRGLFELESFWRPDLVFEGLEIAARELL